MPIKLYFCIHSKQYTSHTMNKKMLWLVAAAFLLGGCDSDGKKAAQLLEQAESAYAEGDYSTAKLRIDSLRSTYPKAFDARKAAIGLMQRVELDEQRKTLAYLDSLMERKQAAFDSIKGQFVLEKDTAYQEIGNYFYPTQVVEKNTGRSFLRAQVSERGEMSLTSIYCGSGIHHTSVKVSVSGDMYAETPMSPDSYETTDLGRAVEKADYKLGADGGVVAFIVANQDKKLLRLEFVGDRNYKTVMQPSDVKAVVAVADLARILSGMEQIRQQQQEARLKIQFVQRKMQEKSGE